MKLKPDNLRARRGAERAQRYFAFVYYQKMKDLRAKAAKGERRFETQIHRARDGFAFLELASVLGQEGLQFGGIIFNPPAIVQEHLRERERVEKRRILQQEEFSPNESDVLFLATRPPLDDASSGVKRIIEASRSDLEKQAFAGLRVFFEKCNRAKMVISDDWLPCCSDRRAEEYRAINFHQKQGARVQYLDAINRKRVPLETRLTVGYLLTVPPQGSLPCRITAAFGMGGTETLWFCHLIRMLSAKPHIKTPWPTDLLRNALWSSKKRLWTIPFLVPDYAPTALKCDPNDLMPKRECCAVFEWELRK